MLSHHKRFLATTPLSNTDAGQAQPIKRAVAVKSISFRFFLILTFIIIGRPQDFLGFLAPFRLALVCTMLAMVTIAIDKRVGSLTRWYRTREAKRFLLFYLVMIFGIPFSIYTGKSMVYVLLLYLPRVIFFILLVIQVTSYEKLKKFLLVVTTSALFYGMLVMVLGWGVQGRLAYGAMYDPNDIAYIMVSLFPPALLFWSRGEKLTRRITALATFGIALLLILLTQSRGGFLGLAAVMALLVISPASGIKKSHRVIIVTLSAIILTIFSAYINLERVESMGNIEEDYNLTEEFGRIAIWKRGLRVALEHPLTGVGVDCFSMAIAQQRRMEGIVPKWQVAHNSFVQVVAETGAVGLLIMVSLILGTLKNLGRQILADPAHPEFVEYNRAGRLLQFAFIGHCICAFFLTQGYSILFILFFGLSAAKRNIEAKDFGLAKSVHHGPGQVKWAP